MSILRVPANLPGGRSLGFGPGFASLQGFQVCIGHFKRRSRLSWLEERYGKAAIVSVSGYLIGSPEANKPPLPPQAEFEWWYQFYFATERGRAGYDKYRVGFNKLIWKLASPKWNFDDATFERSARSFDNPDHVSIVIHNYRWRLGLADGERQYDDLDKRLALGPVITVPTITLEGDANGAPHPDSSAYAKKFSGKYAHRVINGGIGHNLPQEAPRAFAKAIMDVDSF
jgi:pimeloyl-ACP methyl ester carboxylesterase